MADPTDVRVRTGLWRFGATPARLGLDGERLSVTSVDPQTGQTNALIVSAMIDRITASASGSVITLVIEGNPYRLDFGGRGWPARISEWRTVLEFAGLPVPYRSMKPVFTVLITVGVSILVVPYLYSLGFALLGLIMRPLLGISP